MSEKEVKKLKDYSEEVAQQLPLLVEPAKKNVSDPITRPSCASSDSSSLHCHLLPPDRLSPLCHLCHRCVRSRPPSWPPH